MPLTVHYSHQKPYCGSRTVTSAICVWHFVRFRPNFNYDKWPTLNCKTFELWPDHNGQKCDDPPNLASVFNTVNVLTFLCGRLIITQVLTTVPWSLAWSVPGSLNTTSGATRSTWPAGWKAPASWERYKYVRAWNFGRQRKEKLTSRLAQVSSQPKKVSESCARLTCRWRRRRRTRFTGWATHASAAASSAWKAKASSRPSLCVRTQASSKEWASAEIGRSR